MKSGRRTLRGDSLNAHEREGGLLREATRFTAKGCPADVQRERHLPTAILLFWYCCCCCCCCILGFIKLVSTHRWDRDFRISAILFPRLTPCLLSPSLLSGRSSELAAVQQLQAAGGGDTLTRVWYELKLRVEPDYALSVRIPILDYGTTHTGMYSILAGSLPFLSFQYRFGRKYTERIGNNTIMQTVLIFRPGDTTAELLTAGGAICAVVYTPGVIAFLFILRPYLNEEKLTKNKNSSHRKSGT